MPAPPDHAAAPRRSRAALPDFVLASAGYVSNAGCSCGCGVACAHAFERWSCPTDVGYACSGALDDGAP
eukprot:4787483-Prymnesium_polylepis.1